MSFLKILTAPIKLFKKDIITFLVIRRHDLGVIDDKLRYIAVKPNASISVLRQKIWHLLDLPDYCEEIIILKTGDDSEIPLTHLRKGNDPQHPYIMEVWMPGKQRTTLESKALILQWVLKEQKLAHLCRVQGNMLTMGTGDAKIQNMNFTEKSNIIEENVHFDTSEKPHINIPSKPQQLNDTISLNKYRIMTNHSSNLLPDYKQSEISCKFSTSTLFYKLHGRKSRDNFGTLLMKIQSDLNTLTNKLSNLENKIQL